MPYRNLDEFLIRLEQADQLPHHADVVQDDLALGERLRECCGEHAIWLEAVENSDFPVVANLFATEQRLTWALRLETESLDELRERLTALIDPHLPSGIGGMLSRAGDWVSLLRTITNGGQRVNNSQVQQVVYQGDAVNLNRLPTLRFSPEDDCPLIPLAQVIITNSRGARQMQMMDVQRIDSKTLRLTETITADVGTPVAVVLGGDPAAMWCGFAPLPAALDAYLLAGWVRGKPLRFATGVSQPVDVPEDAEIAIEGTLGADGLVHVTAFTHRKEAVFPVIIPESQDVRWLYKSIERLFLPMVKMMLDDVVDLNVLPEAGMHNVILVSIHNATPGTARKVIYGLWGLGNLALTRAIIVVNESVDVQNPAAVAQTVLTRVNPTQDIVIVDGMVADYDGLHPKIGMDATGQPKSRLTAIVDGQRLDALVGVDCWRLWGGHVQVSATDDSAVDADTLWQIAPHTHIILVDSTINIQHPLAIARAVSRHTDWHTLSIHGQQVLINATSQQRQIESERQHDSRPTG